MKNDYIKKFPSGHVYKHNTYLTQKLTIRNNWSTNTCCKTPKTDATKVTKHN
jgi:hypothetical protein